MVKKVWFSALITAFLVAGTSAYAIRGVFDEFFWPGVNTQGNAAHFEGLDDLTGFGPLKYKLNEGKQTVKGKIRANVTNNSGAKFKTRDINQMSFFPNDAIIGALIDTGLGDFGVSDAIPEKGVYKVSKTGKAKGAVRGRFEDAEQ